jgi:macrolide transport system ATP-binding/permease protein
MIVDGAPVSANPNDSNASFNVVSPEYFNMMGIDLVEGRALAEADNEHGRDVAVISESTAKKFWPGQNAIGYTFRMGIEKDRKIEVVGIAHDAEFHLLGGAKQQP